MLRVTSPGNVEIFLDFLLLPTIFTVYTVNTLRALSILLRELNWNQYLVRSLRRELNRTTRIITTGLPDTIHTAITDGKVANRINKLF